MKFYILFFILLGMNTALSAESKLTVNSVLYDVKRELVGPSLVSVQDLRVIALIASGVLTLGLGGWLMSSTFSKEDENKKSNFFKTVIACASGNMLILAGIMEIFLSRMLVTAADELSYKAVQEWNSRR